MVSSKKVEKMELKLFKAGFLNKKQATTVAATCAVLLEIGSSVKI